MLGGVLVPDLSVGTEGHLRLSGSAGAAYEVEATIVATVDERLRVKLKNGREVLIPLAAVVHFAPTSGSPSSSGGSEETEKARSLPGAQPSRPQSSCLADLATLTTGLTELLSADVTDDFSLLRDDDKSLVSELQSIQIALDELQETLVSKALGRALRDVHKFLDSALQRLNASDFAEAARLRDDYERRRKRAKRTLDFAPRSSRVTKGLKDCFRSVTSAELADWKRLCSRFEARPRLVTQDNLHLTVSKAGEVLLPLKVTLDEGPGPARGIRIVLDQHRGVETVGNSPTISALQPGHTETVRVRLKDRRRQGAKNEVRVSAHLEYLGPGGDLHTSPRQRISLRLSKPADFAPIHNPFKDYASGVPVDDPEMFFGRAALIEDIAFQLLERPVGRCYALYGQKRSGKSSVVNRVQSVLVNSGALVARVSMGVVDRSAITQTFVAEVIDQLREQVASALDERTFAKLLTRWPETSAVATQPLASLRRALTAARALLKAAGQEEAPRVVIIVDEFTYLFELLRRDNVAPADQDQLRDFMRQWKSLLEAKVFSALIVGQDTMPSFIEAFPNEFSVMHTERLDYLSDDETGELADRPIRRQDGTTRFSGYGLATVYSYTSGHPYFTQILCDRIVDLANENRRQDIADFDVDAALETLLDGSREIGMFRFDCLLTADNTGVLVDEGVDLPVEVASNSASEDLALRVAHRLARLSAPQNKPVAVEDLDLSSGEKRVFDDLARRSVINVREGKAHLRVMLFAEYLRRRQP